jgi:ubiquitin-like 1-activating enzyme E1 B
MLFRPNHPFDQTPYILPTPLPLPGKKPKEAPKPSTPPAQTPMISRKRTAPDDDHEIWDVEPTPKRSRTAPLSEPTHTNGQSSKTADGITSPQKKQRLEEEGVVIMENPKDNYIVIDDD